MSNVKERILGALTVMSEEEAKALWEIILNNFTEKSWTDIDEVKPDNWDMAMLAEIENNSECKEFVSQETALKELGL